MGVINTFFVFLGACFQSGPKAAGASPVSTPAEVTVVDGTGKALDGEPIVNRTPKISECAETETSSPTRTSKVDVEYQSEFEPTELNSEQIERRRLVWSFFGAKVQNLESLVQEIALELRSQLVGLRRTKRLLARKLKEREAWIEKLRVRNRSLELYEEEKRALEYAGQEALGRLKSDLRATSKKLEIMRLKSVFDQIKDALLAENFSTEETESWLKGEDWTRHRDWYSKFIAAESCVGSRINDSIDAAAEETLLSDSEAKSILSLYLTNYYDAKLLQFTDLNEMRGIHGSVVEDIRARTKVLHKEAALLCVNRKKLVDAAIAFLENRRAFHESEIQHREVAWEKSHLKDLWLDAKTLGFWFREGFIEKMISGNLKNTVHPFILDREMQLFAEHPEPNHLLLLACETFKKGLDGEKENACPRLADWSEGENYQEAGALFFWLSLVGDRWSIVNGGELFVDAIMHPSKEKLILAGKKLQISLNILFTELDNNATTLLTKIAKGQSLTREDVVEYLERIRSRPLLLKALGMWPTSVGQVGGIPHPIVVSFLVRLIGSEAVDWIRENMPDIEDFYRLSESRPCENRTRDRETDILGRGIPNLFINLLLRLKI